MMKKTLMLGAGVMAMSAILFASCKKGDQQAQQQGVPELATLTVTEENTTLETAYPATLHGKNDVEIRPQISGFLTKVHVKEGQQVSAGQVLFTIDQVSLQAAVDAAEAAVRVAEANVNVARTQANNDKILLDKNIISPSAYQTSADQLNAAKAQLAQAQAQVVSAKKNLSYSTVTAPASGVVGTIDYKEGALVSPSTLLTIISNNGEMEAYFSMNEKEVLALTENGKRTLNEALAALPPVSLMLANGELYGQKGKVISLSGVLNQATGSAEVKASFPNTNGMLRSGSTGQVLIPSLSPSSIIIPQKATYELQDMRFCYVLNDSSKAHAVPVTVTNTNDGQHFIVTSGLKPGDVIVTEGVGISVKEGMQIKPKKTR
ncbi:MAG: efflux RND transporter periplasmic adaptor subunit [Prevotella sp.]|nr:efflux RND transporter periplasmic adaptor subunit [Bacteroides sp.]MCM1365888.1 efflux RND transporter periplasmic adaptor subunit [Prevotella sp.]